MKFSRRLSDSQLAILMFLLLLLIQILYIIVKYPIEFNFGYEFGAIADSLLAGKGYSNPWKFNSGPTAAVLPLLVYFHLLSFYLFGKTLTTFIFISVFKFASYGLSYYFIVKSLRLNDIRVHHVFLAFLFLLFVSFSPTLNFEHTGDLWLYILAVSWLFFGISTYFKGNKKLAIVNLSLFYFISPQINPSIALAGIILFMILILMELFKVINFNDLIRFKKNTKSQFIQNSIFPTIKYGIFYAFLFGLSVSIWSIRNYFVFQTFIPTKSNLWMEYYTANMMDSDGLLSASTVLKYHPIGSDSIKELFEKYGEIEMMKKFEIIGKEHRKNNFDVYLRKTLNRLVNAFVYTEYDLDVRPTAKYESFDNYDKEMLNKSHCISKGTWVCLDMNKKEFNSILVNLKIKNKQEVYNDWAAAQNQYFTTKNSLHVIIRSLVMGLFVSASMILLFITKNRSNLLIISTIIFYITYLIPYILVSHQLRYHRPLFAAQLILIYIAVIYIYSKLFPKFKILISNTN